MANDGVEVSIPPADPGVMDILDAWHRAWAKWGEGRVHASEPSLQPDTESSG